eukprot:TRINITY_DN19950_c0_g1_i2.p1 TRINITY_DN19950_c0_g1~~TRINITY_DN19950_c0_g1_i2.p1  ORF type:complete len:1008 (+),score=173.20 TRINITY_DN19950_c0_g1_i2:69-3092(+)
MTSMVSESSIAEEELVRRLNGMDGRGSEVGSVEDKGSVLRVMMERLSGMESSSNVRMSANIAAGGRGLVSGKMHKPFILHVDDEAQTVQVMLSFILQDGRVLGAGTMSFNPSACNGQTWKKTITLVQGMEATVSASLNRPLMPRGSSFTSNISETALIDMLFGGKQAFSPLARTATIPDTISSMCQQESIPSLSPNDTTGLTRSYRDSSTHSEQLQSLHSVHSVPRSERLPPVHTANGVDHLLAEDTEGLDPEQLSQTQEQIAFARLASSRIPAVVGAANELQKRVQVHNAESPGILSDILTPQQHEEALTAMSSVFLSTTGDVIDELSQNIRCPEAHEILERLSHVAYALSINSAVVCMHPRLSMTELLAAMLATCQPVDIDAFVRWDTVGYDTAAYTAEHSDLLWECKDGSLRNGSLLACPSVWPKWHSTVAACCTTEVDALYRGVCVEGNMKMAFKEGDVIAWGTVAKGHASEQGAVAAIPSGMRGVLFHILKHRCVLDLRSLHCYEASEYLLSPYVQYRVKSIEILSSHVWSCKVVLECMDADSSAETFLTKVRREARMASEKLYSVVRRTAASAAYPGYEEHESAETPNTGGFSDRLRRLIDEVEVSHHAPPERLHSRLQDLETLRGEEQQEAEAKYLLIQNSSESLDVITAEAEARAEISMQYTTVADCVAEVWRDALHMGLHVTSLYSQTSIKFKEQETELVLKIREEQQKFETTTAEMDSVKEHITNNLKHLQRSYIDRSFKLVVGDFWWKLRLYSERQKGAKIIALRKQSQARQLGKAKTEWLRYKYYHKMVGFRRLQKRRANIMITVKTKSTAGVLGIYMRKWSMHVILKKWERTKQELHEERMVVEALRLKISGMKVEDIERQARQPVEEEETFNRAEMVGWESGFWRRENVYNERKKKVDEHQTNLLMRIISTVKPLVPNTPDAAITQSQLTKSEQTALHLTEQLAHEVTSLRNLLQTQAVSQISSYKSHTFDRAAFNDLEEAILEAREGMQRGR